MMRSRDLLEWRTERVVIQTAFVIVCYTLLTARVEAFICKFPNEGCDVNKENECCSGKCVDAHPGTNARCTRLGLHNPCLYTYQCDDRLRCGASNKCCSRYWGTCTAKKDCCDPDHSCYEVDGFYYKRCLYANSGHRGSFGDAGCIGGSSFGCVVVRQLMLSSFVVLVASMSWSVATGVSVVVGCGGGGSSGSGGGGKNGDGEYCGCSSSCSGGGGRIRNDDGEYCGGGGSSGSGGSSSGGCSKNDDCVEYYGGGSVGDGGSSGGGGGINNDDGEYCGGGGGSSSVGGGSKNDDGEYYGGSSGGTMLVCECSCPCKTCADCRCDSITKMNANFHR